MLNGGDQQMHVAILVTNKVRRIPAVEESGPDDWKHQINAGA